MHWNRLALVSLCVAVLGDPIAASIQTTAGAGAATERIDAPAWRQDLRRIAADLPQRHPDLFHRLSRAAWDSAVGAIDSRLPTLTRSEAVVAFMELVALPHDGHTSIHPLFDHGLNLHYYPLDLYRFDDGLFVRAAGPTYARLAGARVRRIGKVGAEEALAAVARTISAENEWWQRAWAPQRLMIVEILEGLGLVGDPESLPLVVERDGREETVIVRPAGRIEPRGHDPRGAIDMTGWTDMRKSAAIPLWQRGHGVPYRVEYLEAEKLLYVGYRGVVDMGHGESNTAFWRRVFTLADSVPVERFVLDIRENIGGNNFFNRQVVRGLVARPALDRKDRLFVVTGRQTFSAAMNLALDLERWTNATFVGEPTGNATFFFGDHQQLVLPNTGITVSVSSLPWHPYDPRDRRDFLAPAIYAPLASASYRDGRDPALEAILVFGTRPSLSAAMETAALRGDTLAAERLLSEAKKDEANRFRSLEGEVNRLGYALLQQQQVEPAIAVLRLNTRAYPASANAWDSLGEAMLAAGRREAAIAAYQRALAVDPEFGSSLAALERLGGATPTHPKH